MVNRHLFRGKRFDNGKFVTGFYTWCEDNSFINVHESICVEAETNSFENHLVPYNIDPKTIGQCTGLKDKNGVLIFEDDIVNYEYAVFELEESFNAKEQAEIMFVNGGFFCVNGNGLFCSIGDRPSTLEIIGNIHND